MVSIYSTRCKQKTSTVSIFPMDVFLNGGTRYPQIIHFNRVFHDFHHPFWFFHYFWFNTPKISRRFFQFPMPKSDPTDPADLGATRALLLEILHPNGWEPEKYPPTKIGGQETPPIFLNLLPSFTTICFLVSLPSKAPKSGTPIKANSPMARRERSDLGVTSWFFVSARRRKLIARMTGGYSSINLCE